MEEQSEEQKKMSRKLKEAANKAKETEEEKSDAEEEQDLFGCEMKRPLARVVIFGRLQGIEP